MKSAALTLVLLLIFIVTGCGKPINTQNHGDILATLKIAETSWNNGDLEAYMNCYWQSENLRFCGGDKISTGWQQVLASYQKSYPDKAAMGHLTFTDLQVDRIDKNTALVVGRWRLDSLIDEPHGVFTLLLRQIDGTWLIVHDHTSAGDSNISAAEATITAGDLLKHVKSLTSEKYAGRLPGDEGYDLAALEMADKFANLGLAPGCEDTYLQHLPIEYNQIKEPSQLNLIKDGAIAKKYKLVDDYIYRGFSGSGEVTAPVVFCGYGLSSPERGYDDYAGVNVKGKLVLIFKQSPSWKLTDGEGWNGMTSIRAKTSVAKQYGAVGVLMVSMFTERGHQDLIGSVMHGPGDQSGDIPQLHVSHEVAVDLLAANSLDLEALQKGIDKNHQPASKELATSAQVETHATYSKAADTVNVVAVLPGSDPQLKDEYLVVGAHLDHVGTQAGDAFFPGANDNASGCAAVMEIAEAFVHGGVKPKRSVIFVLFSGEEQGLIGSRYYAENPVLPLEKTVAMLNLDCVACGDSIRIGGGKSSPELWNLARKLDKNSERMTTAATWAGGGADAAPFFEKGLPTLYFVTTNSYEHLHKTTDTVETLNGPLFQSLTRLAYRTTAAVAGGDYQKEELHK